VDFKDRVALITGGTGALGRTVTLDLLKNGTRVSAPYLDEASWKLLRTVAGEYADRLTGEPMDIRNQDDVNQFISNTLKYHERLDFLICVAGGFAAGKSFEADDPAWDRMLDLNLMSIVRMLRPVVPVMVRQNFGRIVTVSSGAILKGGGAGIAPYAVSKGAVLQLTEILAHELEKYDIRAHCILPGTMDTAANRKAMPKADFSKWVRTEDVANVIHFLLSDQSRAVRNVEVPVLG
jgi:NAD(P)-dependent dehydrogenase (short-subunit alcohol dehydrogenase family)